MLATSGRAQASRYAYPCRTDRAPICMSPSVADTVRGIPVVCIAVVCVVCVVYVVSVSVSVVSNFALPETGVHTSVSFCALLLLALLPLLPLMGLLSSLTLTSLAGLGRLTSLVGQLTTDLATGTA